MENEYQVLDHLQKNEKTSQRAIAERTGLSLGAVNILIKKMARKGLIKVEQLNSRTMRYILTPQGMKEKTRLTYNFVRISYQQIMNITRAVETLIDTEYNADDHKDVILYGPADEVEQILKSTLRSLNIKPMVARPGKVKLESGEKRIVLTWRSEDDEYLNANFRVFNIMHLI